MKIVYDNLAAEFEQSHSPDGEKVTGRFVGDIYGFAVVQLEQSEWEDFLDARADGLSVDEAFNELAHETCVLDALLPSHLIEPRSVQWRVHAHCKRDFCISVESFDSEVESTEDERCMRTQDDGDKLYHELHDEGLI
jgi:hypothetical protein